MNELQLQPRLKRLKLGGMLHADFAPIRSAISLQSDQLFRSNPISHFGVFVTR